MRALRGLTQLCLLLSVDRTLIAHTKALDPSRPVTFVTNSNYEVDLGVSLGSTYCFPLLPVLLSCLMLALVNTVYVVNFLMGGPRVIRGT